MAPERTVAVTAHYNHVVPLTLHKEKIMVEITAPSTEKGKTANLDLVVVLDTSGSMQQGHKLRDMKQAAEFVIKKMGRVDTLTIVPFAEKAKKPSAVPPPNMSDRAKLEASRFVTAVTAHGNTNIKDGLQTAVRILHERRDKTGRAAGVFLMSDGKQNIGDARDVPVHDFPVFTFGFGNQHDHKLLHDIAHKSHGGTYHNTPHSTDKNKLLHYFAKALGILRDISVMNLDVTLKPHPGTTILRVDPGNYRVTSGAHPGSSTIHFGELARKERRTIVVDIQLPAVLNNEKEKTVMDVDCSYRLPKERESTKSDHIRMARDRNAQLRAPRGNFQVELARRDHVHRIGNMKRSADVKKFDKAMDELAEAKNALRIIESTQHSMDLLDALSLELEHLEELLESHEVYNKEGSAYLLAAILSHGRQRFAARGGAEDVMIYTLPRMLKYARQANQFHANPNTRI